MYVWWGYTHSILPHQLKLLLDIFPELFFTGGLVVHKTHVHDILYPEAQPKAVLGRMAHSCSFVEEDTPQVVIHVCVTT